MGADVESGEHASPAREPEKQVRCALLRIASAGARLSMTLRRKNVDLWLCARLLSGCCSIAPPARTHSGDPTLSLTPSGDPTISRAQELQCGLGLWGSVGLSLGCMQPLLSASVFQLGFMYGGPRTIIYGFILCFLLCLPLALSMAEIASVHINAASTTFPARCPGLGWARCLRLCPAGCTLLRP